MISRGRIQKLNYSNLYKSGFLGLIYALDLRQPHRCCPPTTLVIFSNLAENEKYEHFLRFFIKKILKTTLLAVMFEILPVK